LPLFPGYLFGRLTRDERSEVFATNRAVGILEAPDQGRLIENLTAIHRAMRAGAIVSPNEEMRPGSPVRIKSGPLAGLNGKIVRIASLSRVVIEVTWLQRDVPIEVDPADLERAV
jgi:transcriptional antiterminator RfaH